MGEKLVVGPIDNAFVNARTAFVINNDAFPQIINAYQWRGRVKRKRGTTKLGRLTRYFNSNSTAYSASSTITLDSEGNGNLITGFSLETNASIIPGTVQIDSGTYTDPSMDGTLSPSGSINYATGDITILALEGDSVDAVFQYYPDLPVMGFEDLILTPTQNPRNMAFDTTYSYEVSPVTPYLINDVSFYKNPPADSTNLPGYTPKTVWTPATWNGQDYQQFWTTNYQGALWSSNGVTVPFTNTNISMQFASGSTTPDLSTVTWDSSTTMDFTVTGNPLVVGDFVFVNEFTSMTPANANTLNFQSGYVITAGDTFTVKFPFATIADDTYTPGMVQYLTNRAFPTADCIRWYDGPPVNSTGTFSEGFGWINFCPPLSQSDFSIADLPADQYYLIGSKMIIPFKDRLVFLGPVVMTSAPQSQVYLPDTVVYSQNGTPYYTASFTGDVDLPTTDFHPILLPVNQSSTASAYFSDQTGFGGELTLGISQAIQSASPNEDVLIVEFDNLKARMVYSGTDIIPFNFFVINSEYGTSSTFSSINMDEGVISRGGRGYTMTSQTKCARIDLPIPDQVFEVELLNNGSERFCSQRDFINEWIYFTYPSVQNDKKFPTQTLFYNYRDESWSIFDESYTTYGLFRKQTGYTWATIGFDYPTWASWSVPWSAGSSNVLNPLVVGGNQQGYLMIRDTSTEEDNSLYIQNISGNTVTSPDHSLLDDDYIIIRNCLGTSGPYVNNQIFQVYNSTDDTFTILPGIPSGLTYLGNGEIQRLYAPYIQTKQFPTSWAMGRKTRIGVQQYLLTKTEQSQITLLIFLSQNSSSAYNEGAIIPTVGTVNSSLIYSTILYTCPESTNIGLTPANTNLQTPTAIQQAQIWHRMNTSLIGDTVQLGFTLSDDQMRSLSPVGTPVSITGITNASPCVISCNNGFIAGNLILVQNVRGMIEINNNNYYVISATSTTVTINVDSTLFGTYSGGGIATFVSPLNQTSEIELHGFILDVSPSQVLV